MLTILNKIKFILSDKRTSIAIIALAIVARIIQLIFFYNIRVDGMYQVLAMQNFVEGHGISLSKVLPGDLSTIIYDPLINWPPGYSLILSPFYILSGQNYILAGIAVDILTAVMMIFTCRGILKILDTPLYLVNLFTLMTGFFIYYFYFINSSDGVAISFFLLAIYFTIRILKRDSFSLRLTLLMVICLFISGLVKYLFIPVVLIIPVFLLLKGIAIGRHRRADSDADKNKAVYKFGVLSFVTLFVSLAGILLLQKISSGNATYISETSRGFFPENLLGAHPAIPSSFINPDTISLVVPPGSKMGVIIFRLLQFMHLLLFLAAFIYVAKQIIKNGFRKLNTIDSFFYLVFFLSAGISLVLVILSLTVGKEENIPGHLWTYVEEPRYYGLINVLVHLGIFILYQYYRRNKTKWLRYSFIILLLLLLPETFRGIWFTANRIIKVNREEYSWQHELEIQAYAASIIKKEKLPGETAVVTGSSYYINYRVGLYDHIPVMPDAGSINDLEKLDTKNPTLLLAIIQEDDSGFNPFLIRAQNGLAGYLRGFYFYTLHVQPH